MGDSSDEESIYAMSVASSSRRTTPASPTKDIYFLRRVRVLAKELWDNKINKQTFNRLTNEALKEFRGELKEAEAEAQDLDDLAVGLGGAKISK